MSAGTRLELPAELRRTAAAGPAAIASAIRAMGGSPLTRGHSTTFVYVGDADGVALTHWMDVFPPLPALERLDGTDLWWLTVDLPRQARIEYKLSVDRNGRRRSILDPLNPHRARDPFGTNSVVTGPGYERPLWSIPNPVTPAGSLHPLHLPSNALEGERIVHVYLPADAGEGPLPVLLVHDGSEYREYAALTSSLDNLIHAGAIQPLAAVLSDPQDRLREYVGDARHARHLVSEVLPAVAGGFDVAPARCVAMGASLGAVASLHAAWEHPGKFAGLLLQSGTFVTAVGGRFRRSKALAPVVDFMETLVSEPGPLPQAVYMSCGRFDGLVQDNRRMATLLRERGIDVTYDEAPDGHNWENWRDRLGAGLSQLFPPVVSDGY